ncbi:unnamed protein product [Lymnaea stagnalis]|uniref:Nucleoredoxin n=1 Tax=Lymnaea stagnalis TaxID=6523 RepID=A0AAV2IAJ0_LYMST
MAHLEEILGSELIGQDGSVVPVSSLTDVDLIGIYFSAHWCPPCRGFTPVLGDFYKKLRAAGKKFEVVFVSSDRDQASCKEYYDSMPWLLLPYAERGLKESLAEKYSIRGIPTLVLVDPKDGSTISSEGRNIVTADSDGEEFPWKK